MLNIGEFARLGQVSPRMLRHYDRIGLLVPDRVDPDSGYRSYGVSQLGRLHRLRALKDLGFTLEQIGPLLDREAPVEELRGMLELRQAQIEQALVEDRGRLRRVEAHLRAIEGSAAVNTQDIVIKHTQPLRVAEATGTAANDIAPTTIATISPTNAPTRPSSAGLPRPAGPGPIGAMSPDPRTAKAPPALA